MAYLVKFDDSGVITGCMSGPDSVLQEAATELEGNCLLNEDRVSNASHMVLDGQLVEKGERPSLAYVWQDANWVYDIDADKGQRWLAVKSFRGREEFGTFEWNGYVFDCDEVSQRRIQGAVQLAALDTSTVMDWTLADNTVQTFNATELQQIGQALGAHVNACHVKARGLRDQINAAESEAELSVISW